MWAESYNLSVGEVGSIRLKSVGRADNTGFPQLQGVCQVYQPTGEPESCLGTRAPDHTMPYNQRALPAGTRVLDSADTGRLLGAIELCCAIRCQFRRGRQAVSAPEAANLVSHLGYRRGKRGRGEGRGARLVNMDEYKQPAPSSCPFIPSASRDLHRDKPIIYARRQQGGTLSLRLYRLFR